MDELIELNGDDLKTTLWVRLSDLCGVLRVGDVWTVRYEYGTEVRSITVTELCGEHARDCWVNYLRKATR